MHVLVFEPRHKGHHFAYVRLVVEALLKLRCRVTLGTGNGVPETIEYAAHIKTLQGQIQVETALASDPGSAADMYHQFCELLGRTKPDHVLVPTGDGLIQQCGLMRTLAFRHPLRHLEAESLIMQCRFAYPGAGLRQRARFAAIRTFIRRSGFSRLFFIDAAAHESLEHLDSRLAGVMGLMPDPIDDGTSPPKSDARRLLGIPEEGLYIGTAGSLDSRKGVDRLVRSFAKARLPAACRLLIAGLVQPDIKETLERELEPLIQRGRAILIDRYLPDHEMSAFFSAIDLLCIPYVRHLGPSSIVTRSARIGTPVLATDYGWCGTMIPRLGVGWVCDTDDLEVFSQALAQSIEKARPLVATPLLSRYLEFSSAANFAATWMTRLRERLSLPPESVLNWDWVLNGN